MDESDGPALSMALVRDGEMHLVGTRDTIHVPHRLEG